ncbi:MAG: ferrous iron transport protein B [Archaeoglobaceae archaeon]|nr:ferrous iron transport protein B [Archaeoglobaceae archaeon]MDW8127695.1 ferrous iron transport protein B [Archaeoglobaceae archaeon]
MSMDRVYLLAQPNSGKTTLFNLLAGESCYVANWPGKTVEVFQAKIRHHGKEFLLIDLPGINSFKTLGKEEELTKEFILKESDGVTLILLNGESLYRSFYFAIQVLEMKSKAILVINKSDYLEKKGVHVNLQVLKERLGVEVVQISALHGIGINQLLDRILDVLEGRIKVKRLKIDYGALESYIERAEKIVGDRSVAIRAIEGEEKILSTLPNEKRVAIEEIKKEIGEKIANPEEMIAMYRYKFVEELLNSAVREVKVAKASFEEKFDKIFFSKFGWIVSIFILFSTLLMAFTINTGFPLNLLLSSFGYESIADLLEEYSLAGIISLFFELLSKLLEQYIPDSIIKDLLINGIIAGIGAVATFFPLILIVNFFMSLIEDSGLMTRIAVSMDRFFAFFGLTGKSVFPFGINMACNVPGVMTSRILETDGERLRVALASPFVICQARLLVIILLVVFFLTSPILQSGIIVSIYLISTLIFLLITKFYGKFFKEETSELMLEIPPYHFPSLRVVWWITWMRSRSFIFKVSQLLLLFAIFAWLMEYLGLANMVGAIIATAFSPIGLEDPRIGFALLMGFFAKELVISSLAISFGTADLMRISAELSLTIPEATALIFFIAFYTPCAATVSALFAEIRNYKLVLFSIITQLLIAYLLAFSIFLILNSF